MNCWTLTKMVVFLIGKIDLFIENFTIFQYHNHLYIREINKNKDIHTKTFIRSFTHHKNVCVQRINRIF